MSDENHGPDDHELIVWTTDDAKSATITANVASLAHALGIVATAEGIENPSQLESARELGCDFAQGYYFARPAPADEVTRLLSSNRADPPSSEADSLVAMPQ